MALTELPFLALLSTGRMIAAFALSVVFSLSYGILAASGGRKERLLIPVLDVLQSVPILGFFPAAVFFLVSVFQGSRFGVEVASVFLIFTSMAWNMAFAVFESASSIPQEISDACRAFGVHGWLRFRKELLPACIPKLVYNGIMSWAAGWYFLIAAEIISLGSSAYKLPGLGSFLAQSIYNGDLRNSIVALFTLVAIIYLVDVLVWRPAEAFAESYGFAPFLEIESSRFPLTYLKNISGILHRFPVSVELLLKIRNSLSPSVKPFFLAISHGLGYLSFHLLRPKWRLVLSLSAIVFLTISLTGTETLRRNTVGRLEDIMASFVLLAQDATTLRIVESIPKALAFSAGRLLAAYGISLSWTLPVALWLTKSRDAFKILMPIFQTFAAIPATAYFPIIVVLTVALSGRLQLASIVLVLTGMQWYLLFNLVTGARSVSHDLQEAADAYHLHGYKRVRRLLLPSMYPSFVTGSITAWGGGWNALIVSEYVTVGGSTSHVLGIGALIDIAAYDLGNVSLVLLCVLSLTALVIFLNRVIWKKLYKLAVSKYRLD